MLGKSRWSCLRERRQLICCSSRKSPKPPWWEPDSEPPSGATQGVDVTAEEMKVAELQLAHDWLREAELVTAPDQPAPRLKHQELSWLSAPEKVSPAGTVFLSYRVSADADLVEKLHDKLLGQGVAVWWDAVCLQAGQKWEDGLYAALGLESRKTLCSSRLSSSALARAAWTACSLRMSSCRSSPRRRSRRSQR